MSTEVVGSAVVKIRISSDGLAKDIESQVKKSVGSVDGKSIGSTLGNSIGTPFSKTLTDSVTSGAKSAGASVEKELTSKISNVGTTIRKAESESRSGFSGISSNAKSLGDSVTASFGSIAAAAAVAFSLVKVKQFFGQAIDAGSALQKQLEANNILFGSSTASVVKFAEGAAQSLGITESQALAATRSFGSLLRGLQIAQAPAAEMSDRLVQLAGDIANFKGVDVETVTKALQSGLAGQTRGLKQLGISLDANSIKQEALDLGLINSKVKLTAAQKTEAIKQEAINEGLLKSGDTLTTAIRAQVETQLALNGGLDETTAAITPAIKAQAIYSLVLKQTGLEQGFFGKTTDDLANQQKILSAEWINAKAALGKDLLPAAVNTTAFLAKEFLPQVVNIANALGGPLNAALSATGNAFQAVVRTFTSSGAFLILGASISSVATSISKLSVALSKVAQTALPVFVKLFSSFIDVGRSAVTVLLTAVNLLAEGFNKLVPIIGDKLARVLQTISPLLSDTANLITAFFNAETRALDNLVTSIQKIGNSESIISGVVDQLQRITGLKDTSPIITGITDAFDKFSTSLKPVSDDIANFVSSLGNGLDTTIKDLTTLFQGFADNGVQGLTDAFAKLQPEIQPITDALQKQKDIIIPITAAVAGFISTIVTISTVGAVLSTVSAIAGSLSTIITGLTIAVEGFSIGAAVTAGLVVAAIAAIVAVFVIAFLKIKPFHDLVIDIATTIRDTAIKEFDNFKIGLSLLADKFTEISGQVSKFAGIIADAFQALPDKANTLAQATIKAITPLNDWINANLISTLKAAAGFFSALFDRILDIIEPAAKTVLQILKLLATVVQDVLGAAFKVAVPILEDFGTVLLDLIRTVADVALPLFEGAFKAVEIVVRTVFDSIKAIIEGALQVIRGIFEVGEGILRGNFSKIWEGLVDIVKGPFHAINGVLDAAFSGFVDLITSVGPKIGEAAKNLFLGLLNAAIDLITGLPAILDAAFHAVLDLITKLPGQIGKAAVGIFDALTSRGPFSELKRLVIEAFDGIIDFIKSLPGRIAEAAKDLFKGLIAVFIVLPVVISIELLRFQLFVIKFFLDMPKKIADAAVDLFHGVVDATHTLADFLKENIPKAFDAVVTFLFTTLPQILHDSVKDLYSAIINKSVELGQFLLTEFPKLFDSVTTFLFTTLPQIVHDDAVHIWDGLTDSASNAADSVVNFALSIPDKLIALADGIKSAGKGLGEALLQGLIDGITGAAGAVEGFAKALVRVVNGFINDNIIDKINSFSITIPNPVGSDFHIDIPKEFQIPHLATSFAKGGIALSRPGGTLAQIAEAGSNEAVIPLNGQGTQFLAASMEAALRSISSRSSSTPPSDLAGLNTSPIVGQMTVIGSEPVETARQVVKKLRDIQTTVVRR